MEVKQISNDIGISRQRVLSKRDMYVKCVCVGVCVQIYICMYVYIYIYIYTRNYISSRGG